MKKTFTTIWNTLTLPLSISKEKMNREHPTRHLVVVWAIAYSILCTVAYILKQDFVEPAGNLYLFVELTTLLSILAISSASLELAGNYRRANLRKTLNK
tara:strand:+ start:1201 stop:1497 length:297 start_codon:yes stop_codon:yes gene_type:complete